MGRILGRFCWRRVGDRDAVGCRSGVEPERAAAYRRRFFPESITAGPDGALYVSSLDTGDIVRFAPGAPTPTPFVTRRQCRHHGGHGRP